MTFVDGREHHYGYSDLKWEYKVLYFGERELARLVPHAEYPYHWHIKFHHRDEPTPEFFNIFNAKENASRIALYNLNREPGTGILEPR